MMIYDDKAINRLKRAEGQIKGILRMIEQDKDCKEVITQLSAVRSAIDRTIAVIVSSNLEHCIRESIESGNDSSKLVEEAVNMLVKSR
jgi:DNA-binding FrmR family transcriptional regulator